MEVDEVFSELLADNWEIINLNAGTGDGDLSHSYKLIGDYNPEHFDEDYESQVQHGGDGYGEFKILNVYNNRVDLVTSFSIENSPYPKIFR
jgi:hypothetical protein